MANIPLKSIKFPDLADIYTVPSNAGELPYDKSATYPADTVGKALQDKPDADGTIANAEQLTSNIYEEDNTPYNFRTSGGSIDIGDRETDMLVGGTVGWNQLLKPLASNGGWSIEGGVTATFSDGVASISSTIARNGIINAINWRANHKYLLAFDAKASSDMGVLYGTSSGSVTYIQASVSGDNQWHTFSSIKSAVADYTVTYIYGLSANYNIQVKNAVVIDLTALFGSTIADYIYSLETANAGAGVAWFKKLFPKPYYAYNAGELMSVQAASHDTVGFNAYDPATGTAKLVGGMQYQITGTYTAVSYSTGETITIDSGGYFTPMANGTLTVTGGNDSDTCVHLVWDGERDGEYEEYVKHSYALDSDLVLRGIPKLDSSNNLYYDGDTYESGGTVTRNTVYRAYASGDESLANAITDGTHTVVYSANNSTETADPYTNPQIVNDFGTEEYVDYAVSQGDRDVAIPVGHETQYMANLKAKLEMSPNSPEGAGDYIVRQTNGENEYVTLASNATIQDIIARLEALEGQNAES